MKPVNIFRVSRIHDERLFNIMEKHEASDHDNHSIRIHEIESLCILTDALAEQGITVKDADGFYFGFVIPFIGKEFDLIKVTNRYCLNIELKSQDVGEEQILAQLRKNRHYLTLLGREMMLFTVVTDTLACYRLSDDGELEATDIGEIAKAVRKCCGTYHGRIDKLFRASEYLISPEEDPDRFLQGQYFLSPAQDYVKSQLLRDMSNTSGCSFFHIFGRPCTGKTLLVYDLAKHLSGSGRTLITCGEEPSAGLQSISKSIENLDFIAETDIASADQISGYEFILVDEALRIDPAIFDIITGAAGMYKQVCIFSTDPDAALTDRERKNNIEGRIRSLGLTGESTAVDFGFDVILGFSTAESQRLFEVLNKGGVWHVFVHVMSVDDDGTFASFDVDTGDRFLSTTSAIELSNFSSHFLSPYLISRATGF